MLQVEEAQQKILSVAAALGIETVLLREAAGRVLAQSIVASISLPRFDNSAMDGYAVRAADVANVTASSPVMLRRIGAVAAGAIFEGRVEPKTCVRLFTGSPLPAGADAVVMQEDTRASGETIEVLDAVKPWENIRLAGEDVKQGSTIARVGERLDAARLALPGAVGVGNVEVSIRPRVGILSTGNELIEAGATLQPGQIYESNRAAIAALVTNVGGIARVFPLVADSLEATQQALRSAFAECDVVVSTGGVSVGEYDLVKQAFESIGGTHEFWQVAMKPGKPFLFGRLGGKFLFGLPGNPVSAFVTFLMLARPALLKMQGAEELSLPAHPGTLAEPLHNRGARRHFMRVSVDATGQVRSAGLQASHALGTLARANGLVNVPAETLWPAGTAVQVLRWGY
ncbi:MAG TPA: gephyrin-like molybdotransferase Glp [Candidatus Limnocylindria bacterium]|nr:gephyrin-like molybdotransferase Glp [Candidatus Limnocylindria bacterium]